MQETAPSEGATPPWQQPGALRLADLRKSPLPRRRIDQANIMFSRELPLPTGNQGPLDVSLVLRTTYRLASTKLRFQGSFLGSSRSLMTPCIPKKTLKRSLDIELNNKRRVGKAKNDENHSTKLEQKHGKHRNIIINHKQNIYFSHLFTSNQPLCLGQTAGRPPRRQAVQVAEYLLLFLLLGRWSRSSASPSLLCSKQEKQLKQKQSKRLL